MKKILMAISLVLLMTSCTKKVEVNYVIASEITVYAVIENTKTIDEVSINYNIDSKEALFNLFTIHQNYFPIGYTTMASPNVSLLSSQIINNEIYYQVDDYIYFSDIELFSTILDKTSRLHGYSGAHILLNNKEIS